MTYREAIEILGQHIEGEKIDPKVLDKAIDVVFGA